MEPKPEHSEGRYETNSCIRNDMLMENAELARDNTGPTPVFWKKSKSRGGYTSVTRRHTGALSNTSNNNNNCLLYTSDAADE